MNDETPYEALRKFLEDRYVRSGFERQEAQALAAEEIEEIMEGYKDKRARLSSQAS